MSPRPRAALIVAIVVAGIALAVLAVLVAISFRSAPQAEPGVPSPDYALPVDLPGFADSPTRPGIAGHADAGWVDRVASAAGIPERALAAYAGAAIAKSRAMPECGVSWTTLAAIGLVESDHGRHGGSSIGDDGTVSPPIFGIALDGASSAHIPDSDDGAIDGDAEFDRAVGPMQLIPQTWRNWHVDGNQDGTEDPQNMDDAVDATTNYLCRASSDMVSREGWRAGVGAFNSSDEYVQAVADAANRYSSAVEGG